MGSIHLQACPLGLSPLLALSSDGPAKHCVAHCQGGTVKHVTGVECVAVCPVAVQQCLNSV